MSGQGVERRYVGYSYNIDLSLTKDIQFAFKGSKRFRDGI